MHWLTLLLIAVDAVHVYAGWLQLLLAMHSAAALYHHFWRRDGVMRRMLPSLGT